MARPTTWKEMNIRSGDDIRELSSYSQSCAGAWKNYIVDFDFGNGWILTNLPWSELRAWFSFSGVSFPRDYLTSKEHPYPDD